MKTTSTDRPADRARDTRRLLIRIVLFLAAFETVYAIAGTQALTAMVGDLAQIAVNMASGASGSSGACPGGCNDGNPCTTDACVNGACQNTPRDCDDHDPCTIDSCDAGGCHHEPLDCDDGSECTTDACENGSCVYEAVECDDGELCNGLEGCDPATGCTPGTPVECPDDGTVCTEESCDPETGLCRSDPANEGECCERDQDDCTQDVCDENGVCVHPVKDDPSTVDHSVNFSISKQFDKHLTIPLAGKIGFGTEFGVFAKVGASTGLCAVGGEVGGNAALNATFIGKDITIEAEASGAYECEDPLKCTTGCDDPKQCDGTKRCCHATGSGQLTVNRGWQERWKILIGSFYFKASVGGGLAATAEYSGPVCEENGIALTLGPVVQGYVEGGFEVCNSLVKWVCGCSQGRDKWTGQFTTSCSNCTRCTPYASAQLNGRITGQAGWRLDGSFTAFWEAEGCIRIGGIKIGPVKFDGYQACSKYP